MKKLLLILLPPLVAFLLFAGAIRLNSFYYKVSFETISDGTLHSLMAYFYFFSPLLFLDAVLTQGLFVIPLWRWLKHTRLRARILAIMILIIICLIFSLGVSYMMWGSVNYFAQWMRSCVIMILVQIAYWFVVISLLYLIDHRKENAETVKTENVTPNI